MATPVGVLFGLLILAGYPALAIYLSRKSWALGAANEPWLRVLLTTLVLAAFFAPGVAASGHGVALAPAWLVIIDPESTARLRGAALIYFFVTWGAFFAVGLYWSHRVRAKQQNERER